MQLSHRLLFSCGGKLYTQIVFSQISPIIILITEIVSAIIKKPAQRTIELKDFFNFVFSGDIMRFKRLRIVE